ncbi:NADPH oxidase organizer 1-like [Rana temporaria]|uniref:NADPH oxidase organizer 1-like n=1 Tax=Rana temporaria TaxID=8407 RepID=UPI001AADC9CE|nr:NADPH oxidase organizer 1-like [Rana temporaria]
MVQPTCCVYEFQLCTGESVTIGGAGDNGTAMSRYPVDAKAIGLVQHGRQKLYMLSILWSDRNNIIIYRTYDSFKELSKLLSQSFPLEAGLVNKSDRTLPILKDVPLFFRTRFSSRFMDRLYLLELYSQELVQTDPKVSQCEDVIYFFSPNTQDLTPSFPENSLVILPPENDQKQKVMISPSKSDQPITQPIVSEPYLCLDTYETKDTKNQPFKVQKNEQVDVLIKDATGWWLVENGEKRLAWFPAPYLVKPESAHMDLKEKSFSKGTFYYVQKGYEAQNSDEISLGVGVVVEVIEKSENGWWLICYSGRFGYAPGMFLKPYKNPHQNLQVSFNHETFGSTPNLLNSISSENLNKDLSLDLPSGGLEKTTRKARLEKRKSISLINLQDSKEDADLGSLSRRMNFSVEWCKQDSGTSGTVHFPSSSEVQENYESHSEWTKTTTELEEERRRKDSGFDEQHSPPISIASNHGDTPPPIPERPSLQEIHARCTTITKRAIVQPNV